MALWHGNITLEDVNALSKNTLGEALGMRFIEVGEDFLVATMPVDHRTKQPFGLLHGGASVALAETMGSVASWCCVNRDAFMGVGIEINANHLRSVTTGFVKGTCRALKAGGKLHIWEIRIEDEEGRLCCVSRFTCMVVPTAGLKNG